MAAVCRGGCWRTPPIRIPAVASAAPQFPPHDRSVRTVDLLLCFYSHEDSISKIEGVKEQRCLYDQTSEDFSNRTAKMEAWMEVTKAAIGDQFNELSETARSQVCSDVQKRWRHLRDAYVKTNKQKKARPYIFSQELSFLKGTHGGLCEDSSGANRTRKRQISDEPDSTRAASAQHQPQTQKLNSQIKIAQVLPAVTSRSDLPPDTHSASKAKKSNITEFEKMLLNIVKTNVEHVPGPPDPDEMFFLSQMPHIKALSPEDREDFKHKFMELLKYYTTVYD
ncbi:hypothetical protein GE061_005807 [Apolygus lucorum]|uniref:MADF domain-containing protein n=1 Tax=Apolygus lucorum TaxID=248454 RepID=A0A6A4IUJ5_APOLU|nr:hypothetical protein GE061_005807 [Apolygus lucorum]